MRRRSKEPSMPERFARPAIAILVAALALFTSARASAQPITEGFENVSGLSAQGWVFINASAMANPAAIWTQGNPITDAITAQSGTPTSFAVVDYTSTNETNPTGGTISNWLITPLRTFNNGDVIRFFTQKPTPDPMSDFPDRMQVRLSASTTAPAFSGPTDVGTFTTLLLDINPTLSPNNPDGTTGNGYPTVWTQFTLTLSGLSGPTQGRIGFRYFVDDGGVNGNNSDEIAIDTFSYSPVPEPGTLWLLGGVAITFAVRRLRRYFSTVDL
jgi:hypothetical protein